MSTDLTDRIAALAREWETQASPIELDELIGRPLPTSLDPEPASFIAVVTTPTTSRPRTALLFAGGVATAAAVVGVLVFAGTGERDRDDVGPVPVATDAAIPSSAAQTTDVVSTTEPPPVTTTSAPPTPIDIASRLAEIDDARALSLRQFTSVGFIANHVAVGPDGTVESSTSADVVLRNDGSLSLTSDSTVWSFFDATTGIARLAYTGPDGQTAYQEVVGLADNSLPLGAGTGLPNGIFEPFPLTPDYVVDIADDVVDGRPTWRIDRDYGTLGGSTDPDQTMSIWIDVATGVTVQLRSTGMQAANGIPLTDTVTLSDLDLAAVLPADFPGTFPDVAVVAPSGDALAFGPTTVEQAAAEFGVNVVVPTEPADVVAISQMNFGNDDGTTSSSPSLIVRWFDGFVPTEYRLAALPPSMALPDSCTNCAGTLLDELRDWTGDSARVDVHRDALSISITGPTPAAIQKVIDSLVEIP
jgi:hypothetical protein